jgi:hypothetical protein
MSCGENVEQNLISKSANKPFTNATIFKYLETITTNQIRFREEIKSKLNSTGKQATIKSRLFRPNLYI